MKKVIFFFVFIFITAQAQDWNFVEGQYGLNITGNVSTTSETSTDGSRSGVFSITGTSESNGLEEYYVMGEFHKEISSVTGDFLLADVKLKTTSAEKLIVSLYVGSADTYTLLESYTSDAFWHTFSGSIEGMSFNRIIVLLQTTSSSETSVSGEVYIDNIRVQHGIENPTFDVIETFGEVTSVEDNVDHTFALHQNYPNPFNPSTRIEYSIPSAEHVTLKVYNILGGEVAVLVDQLKTAGDHTLELDGSFLSSGIYFYTLSYKEYKETKKMILVK